MYQGELRARPGRKRQLEKFIGRERHVELMLLLLGPGDAQFPSARNRRTSLYQLSADWGDRRSPTWAEGWSLRRQSFAESS
jgi:hypothetical protein